MAIEFYWKIIDNDLVRIVNLPKPHMIAQVKNPTMGIVV